MKLHLLTSDIQAPFQCQIKRCAGRLHDSLASLLQHITNSHMSRISLPCPVEGVYSMTSYCYRSADPRHVGRLPRVLYVQASQLEHPSPPADRAQIRRELSHPSTPTAPILDAQTTSSKISPAITARASASVHASLPTRTGEASEGCVHGLPSRPPRSLETDELARGAA